MENPTRAQDDPTGGYQLIDQLIDQMLDAAGRRDFAAFNLAAQHLHELPSGATHPTVQARVRSTLTATFGPQPSYDQLIRAAKAVHRELAGHINTTACTVEAVIRNYYGDPDLLADLPGDSAPLLELAIAGLLSSAEASGHHLETATEGDAQEPDAPPLEIVTWTPDADAARIDDADQVAAYLDATAILLAAPMADIDMLDPERPTIGSLVWRTDGRYVFGGSLNHYVRTYAIAPPRDMLDHIREHHYVCGRVDRDRLDMATRLLTGTTGREPARQPDEHDPFRT